MVLDARTLMLAHAAQNAILCVILGLTALQNRGRVRGPTTWFWGYAFYLGAALLFALRGAVPDWVSYEGGNLLMFAGAICVPLGCASFVGRRPRYGLAAAGLVAAMGLYFWFHYGLQSYDLRISLLSCVVGASYLYSACDIIIGLGKSSRWNATVAFVAFLLAMAINVLRVVGIFMGPERNSLLDAAPWDGLYYSLALVVTPGVAFTQLQLVNGKLLSAIVKASEERALLVRESNHRIKNNLAIAESLVSLEGHRVSDGEFGAILESLGRRIHSIALVHEKLSHLDSGGSTIRADDYLAMIVGDLRESGTGAAIETKLAPLELNARDAVPLGLVANELVVNAMKHAATGGRPASISVTLESDCGMATLAVRDDGPGFSEARPGARSGLGGMLLDALATQLDGTIARRSEGGAVVELSFPVKR